MAVFKGGVGGMGGCGVVKVGVGGVMDWILFLIYFSTLF